MVSFFFIIFIFGAQFTYTPNRRIIFQINLKYPLTTDGCQFKREEGESVKEMVQGKVFQRK